MTLTVFISHAGPRAHRVAVSLQRALSYAVPPVVYRVASAAVPAGGPWPRGLLAELRSADLGVVCVTREALEDGRWLHFEAGLLAAAGGGVRDRRFIPFLVDVDADELAVVHSPLALFRPAEFDQVGFEDLAAAVNSYLAAPLEPDELSMRTRTGWSHLEQTAQEFRLEQELGPAVGRGPTKRRPRPVRDEPADAGTREPARDRGVGAPDDLGKRLRRQLDLLRQIVAGQGQAIDILDEVESALGGSAPPAPRGPQRPDGPADEGDPAQP